MTSSKRSKDSDSSDTEPKSPSKKSCARTEGPESIKDALEAVRYREPIQRGEIGEQQYLKERIEEARKNLELLSDLQDMLLLQEPAAEILETMQGSTGENDRNGHGLKTVAGNAFEKFRET
ncbi:hypothetical protein P170DRAFT_510636 [Aspergillus steynii IBT 23096]|uniref:Uncharacterized protein n=1 Tax=Aspergillus steynii IBT 23096 TaxID=1392250 RepID=A0A2I2G4Y4_9EURO|nr:uncharacterized protein P170DRAFT_510636 [Aspergillus steynii IBT 23096]PLB47934.1 hypothetical protein P170DRAFT_510636 [Aspergillus steynii IBT 23096]